MKKFILGIDQGTTGTTSVLVDTEDFTILNKVTLEFPQIFPMPGQVEHNLHDIWQTVQDTIKILLKRNNIDPHHIISIGITNQRETVCAFDKKGNPLSNAIVWQDRRTHSFCSQLKNKGLEKKIHRKTGLTIDPYFSATKINWLLKNNSRVQEHAQKNDLYFGTIDTFLLFKLTNFQSFATESSNASRTMLMNIETGLWDEELLSLFEISKSFLPQIKDSFGHFGVTQHLNFLPNHIPISGILGDQQSALLGQAATTPGKMKCTYGTGAFLLMNIGEKIQYSHKGLLTTIFYQYQDKKCFALEGSAYIAGAAVQWLRDSLKIIKSSSDIEALAQKIKNLNEMEYLLFHPFFTGMGSPYWQSEAKASIIGLTRDTTDAHIARACLEGMALSIDDLVEAFSADAHLKITSLNVDGGVTLNNLFLQIQANFSQMEVIRPKIIETTAFGAILAAAIGIDLLELNQIEEFWQIDQKFKPENNIQNQNYYIKKKQQWKESLQKIYLA